MHGSKRKGAAAFAVLTIAALAIVASAFARADVAPTAASASTAGCDSPTIGFMGPITGDAAFIGKEQLGFAQYAIKRLAKGKIKLTQGDTQLDPAQASTVGAKFQADSNMLAVVWSCRQPGKCWRSHRSSRSRSGCRSSPARRRRPR